MWVCEAARLVSKHAMHKGAAKEDLTAIVKYIERDARSDGRPRSRGDGPRGPRCCQYHIYLCAALLRPKLFRKNELENQQQWFTFSVMVIPMLEPQAHPCTATEKAGAAS
jgi:hypothetical protein